MTVADPVASEPARSRVDARHRAAGTRSWPRIRLTLAVSATVLAGWALSGAQTAATPVGLGAVDRVTRTDHGLALEIGRDEVTVEVCRPDLLQVHFLPGHQSSPPTPCIARTRWPGPPMHLENTPAMIEITTAKMLVRIRRNPCRIAVCDPAGHLLIGEAPAGGVHPGGVDFTTARGSHFYGLKGWEFLDESNGRMELAPRPAPYRIQAGSEGNTGGPLLWSNRGYGVFVDTTGGECALRSATDVRFSDLSRRDVDYYVMVGTPPHLQTLVADLTGHPPMFPKWALGFANSEFTPMTEKLALANVAGYRKRHIPFDLYLFDFQWKAWGEDNYGEWRWNTKNFPGGPSGEFRRRMAAEGVKLGGIMKPRILVDSVQGRYATAHHFWVPGRKPYVDYFSHKLVDDLNFSLPACRAWFWKHAEPTFDTGMVAWWNDEADAWGDTWENMYMEEALYEGQRAHTHGRQRVWSLNRDFYSGSQRYAYATWSGDIDSGFHVMREQRERLLCSVNVGQARWSMDTGGFNNHNHITGEEYDESYARWMEFAAFVPIFRTHGTVHHQPWLFGPKAEEAATKAIRLRYSLIPYLYAYDRSLNLTGVGLVRPLVWEYPDDPTCFNRVDAWMVGDYLLVSPVVKWKQTRKEIRLPPGVWYDYFRGTRYAGGRTIDYAITPGSWDDIPLFIKAGAIIPSMDVMDYVGERPVTRVYVDVFPTARETHFDYYDDDGVSYAYEHGGYFSQVLGARTDGNRVALNLAAPTGSFHPALNYYLFRVHAPAGGRVRLDGAELPRVAGVTALEQGGAEAWATGSDVYGPVTWIRVTAGRSAQVELIEQPAGRAAPR